MVKKVYEAPVLFCDEYVADTMIASGESQGYYAPDGGPKNGNAGNNQNCWGYNCVPGYVEDGENACLGNGISVGC